MRRRRTPEDDIHNKERWLISYADFITLLFAFFVVMYSVSSVNEGKYKVLSETLSGVFNAPPRSVQPVQVGEQPARTPARPDDEVIAPPVAEAPRGPELDAGSRTEALNAMADQLALAFDQLISQG
ncbi:MAG: flagellar motor protein MotB, partial [Marinobacter sp.]